MILKTHLKNWLLGLLICAGLTIPARAQTNTFAALGTAQTFTAPQTVAPTATNAISFITNCPSGISTDCVEFQINATKYFWLDQNGVVYVSAGLSAASDGTHAGILSLVGNTTVPASYPANSFGFLGPNSASFTSYFFRCPSTGPSGSSLMILAAVSGNLSACTFATTLPTGMFPALTGDVTNSAGSLATTVGKINGAAFPTSAAVVGSNGSAQPIAATASSVNGVIQGLTGCNTATYIYTPQAADCIAPTAQLHVITFVIDGGGSAITTGALKDFPTANYSCTINKAQISSDQSGSITVDIWKAAGAIPTSGNKISASAPVTLSSAQINQNSSLTGWTTAVSVGDVFGFSVASVSTVTHVVGQIWCQ